MPEELAVTPRRSGDLITISVSGELDLGNVEVLDRAIRAAEKEEAETIFIDLRELSFMDSTGLGMLLDARRRSDRIRFIPSEHDAVAKLIALTDTEDTFGYVEKGG